MIASSAGDDIGKKADSLFDNWKKRIIERYKEEKVKKAAQVQNAFDNSNIENVLREDTKEQLEKHFVDTFGKIIDQTMEDTHELRFVLMRFTSDTKYFLQEQSLHAIYEDLDGILVDHDGKRLRRIVGAASGQDPDEIKVDGCPDHMHEYNDQRYGS